MCLCVFKIFFVRRVRCDGVCVRAGGVVVVFLSPKRAFFGCLTEHLTEFFRGSDGERPRFKQKTGRRSAKLKKLRFA